MRGREANCDMKRSKKKGLETQGRVQSPLHQPPCQCKKLICKGTPKCGGAMIQPSTRLSPYAMVTYIESSEQPPPQQFWGTLPPNLLAVEEMERSVFMSSLPVTSVDGGGVLPSARSVRFGGSSSLCLALDLSCCTRTPIQHLHLAIGRPAALRWLDCDGDLLDGGSLAGAPQRQWVREAVAMLEQTQRDVDARIPAYEMKSWLKRISRMSNSATPWICSLRRAR